MCQRQHLSDQFCAFAPELRVHSRHPGNVAARPTEALDKPARYRVSGERHHNRDIMCRRLCSLRGWSEPSHDEVHTRRVVALTQASNPFSKSFLEQIEAGASVTGIVISNKTLSSIEELEAAFADMATE